MATLKKKIIAASLACILLTSGGIAMAAGGYKKIEVYFERIHLKINDQPLELNRDSIIYNGTIYLPLRNLTESLGAEVSWNDRDRSVNLDFMQDEKSQILFNTAKQGLYQYISIQHNDILNEMLNHFKADDMEAVKGDLARYEKLKEIAEGLQDQELAAVFEKLMSSGELFRSGYSSKNLDDYYLAWTIFQTNAGNLISVLKSRIQGSAANVLP